MNRSILMIVAMAGSALSPLASTAAMADTIPEPAPAGANATTLADMQNQCDAWAAAYDTGNGDIWEGTVVVGAASKVSGPTEVAGTRDIDEATIQHAGTYVPSTLEIRGDPFRIGGSVNMFGDQWSTAGYWTNSTYNYTADFDSTFSYGFTCNITQEVYHPGYTVHHRAEGYYTIVDDYKGNDEQATRQNCEQQTDNGQPWWGDLYIPNENNPRCKFVGTQAYDEIVPERWDAPVLIASPTGAVEQSQTDSLYAFEDEGGPVQVTGEYKIGQVVVCISPSTTGTKGNPGAWRQQNGYTGNKCTTDYFKIAPWGSGTQTSNGTYISVPNYSY